MVLVCKMMMISSRKKFILWEKIHSPQILPKFSWIPYVLYGAMWLGRTRGQLIQSSITRPISFCVSRPQWLLNVDTNNGYWRWRLTRSTRPSSDHRPATVGTHQQNNTQNTLLCRDDVVMMMKNKKKKKTTRRTKSTLNVNILINHIIYI